MKLKNIFCAVAFVMTAMTASAENDSIKVRMDFNENPWGMEACPYGLNSKGKTSWSVPSYEPAGSRLTKTTIFEIPACGDKLTMTLTPSDLDETDYDNAMVRDENYNNNDIVETYLYAFTGSKMTFKSPKGYRMAKVAFDTYRSWASGGLYSSDATNNQHIWGPDSVKTRTTTAGGVEYTYECWSGDAFEWSLPPVTSATRLRFIDFWLLPADETAIQTVATEKKYVNVTRPDGVIVRRNVRREQALEGLDEGIYFIDGKKYRK